MLTKPTEKILLSYSKSSAEGSSLRPAYLVSELLKMFPQMKVQEVKRDLAVQELTEKSGISYLVEGLQNHYEGLSEEWQELYTWYKKNPAWAERINRMVEAAFYENPEDMLST